jgi:hypothetical protein
MNARAEAAERIGHRYEVRVLEPSPPAVDDALWFADDPVARGAVPPGRQVVSPVASGDLLWADLARDDEALQSWCADRWLAAYRPLEGPPGQLVATRQALQRLAAHVVSPARERANGKIGLRYTRGGFGTPFFNSDVQVRVRGTDLIVQQGEAERSAPITTLAAAASHLGNEIGVAAGDDSPLQVDPGAAAFLGDWYGFAASVLEELRASAGRDADPSRVQLWPGQLDLAVELGPEDRRARATYGLSPGDDAHPEPYVYVAPWVEPEAGELWQASGFSGAELTYAELLGAEDQRAAALEYLHTRMSALTR